MRNETHRYGEDAVVSVVPEDVLEPPPVLVSSSTQ